MSKPDLKLLEALNQMQGGPYQESLKKRLDGCHESLRGANDDISLRRFQGAANLLVELIQEIDGASETYQEAIVKVRSADNPDRSRLCF